VRGFVLGANVAGALGYIAFFVIQVTGTASVMMGDQAERLTVDELRPLRRQGWELVNRMALKVGDIDHVLVGPGGAIAIETKWSSDPWQLDPPGARVLAAVRQSAESARLLGLWHGFRSRGVSVVEPVVMLWGGGIAGLPEGEAVRQIHGVTVVAGPHAHVWRTSLHGKVLSTSQIADLWQAMSEHVGRRDAVDRIRHPVPTSLSSIWWHAWGTVTAAIAGLLVAASVLQHLPTPWWGPAGAALLVAGWISRRWGPLRAIAWGWIVAVSATSLAVLTVFAVQGQ
jgi:hypothetical protein